MDGNSSKTRIKMRNTFKFEYTFEEGVIASCTIKAKANLSLIYYI